MGKSCQIVLLAAFVLGSGALGSGCYLDHGRGVAPIDAGGPAVPDASLPPRDASPGAADSGLPPPLCAPARADLTCLESFVVEPGRPFTLPYVFDQCACCAESECRVAVDRGARTLSISTTLCPDPCDCVACNAPRGTCEVPALDEGDWLVVANDAPAFVLPVHVDSGFAPPPPACARYAEPDDTGCGPSTPVPGRPVTDDLCFETEPRPDGLDIIRLRASCWPCADRLGPCIARLEPRLTDDLPPGGELFLEPTSYPIACDVDCPAVCLEQEIECFVPELVEGDLYRVHVGERTLGLFSAGTPGTSCAVLAF